MVLMVGPFPPPTHGLSVVVESLAGQIGGFARVVKADMSSGSLQRGVKYHLRRIGRTFAAMARILRYAGKGAAVYIAIAGGKGNVYFIFLTWLARLCNYKIFIDHHSYSYINSDDVLVRLLTSAAGPAANHTVLSAGMGRQLAQRYGLKGPLHIVSNAARVAPGPAPQPHSGPLRVGFLANLTWDKGLAEVLALRQSAAEFGIDMTVDLAGPANGDEHRAITEAVESAKGGIVWHGPLYHEQKTAYYRSLDLFVFPTRYVNEAQPLVLFEALANGVPVVSVGRGCIADDITPELGIVVPVGGDFSAALLPCLKAWSVDRPVLEDLRRRAWTAYGELHRAARQKLDLWVERIAAPSDAAGRIGLATPVGENRS